MRFEGTSAYVATDDLKVAVNAAATLRRPLLVKGEPGTGKTVLAQEIVKVAGIDATRVVIAPPQTELARIIKSGLAAAYQGADKESRAYAQAQKLYFFYGARHFEPLWLEEGKNGKVSFAPAAEKIMEVL